MSSFKDQLQTLPSVAGIVHSAMVLRDEFVKAWTFESFTDVMGPKIKGNMPIRAYLYLYETTVLRLFNSFNKLLVLNDAYSEAGF